MSGIVINEDNTHYFFDRGEEGADTEKLCELVQNYCCGDVGEVVYNINAMRASVAGLPFAPMWQDVEFRSDGEYFMGEKISEKNGRLLRGMRAADAKGIDVYKVWLNETRRLGRRAVISIRMNDVHDVANEKHFFHSEFWREHPEYRREKDTPLVNDNPMNKALDFAHPEVSQYTFNMIKAVLDRYDIDGLELDWMRFCAMFRAGYEDEGRAILTEFQKQVSEEVKKAESRYGHPITLSARVPATPNEAFDWGYDVVEWANKGYVDRIVPSPFFSTADFEIPISFWRRIIPEKVKIDVGIELLLRPFEYGPNAVNTFETVAAQAANYLYQGADRIYLFNYMDSGTAMHNKEDYKKLLHTLGKAETAANSSRRHVVTYHDLYSCGSQSGPVLPLICRHNSRCGKYLRMDIGPAPEKHRKAELIIGTDSENPPCLVPYLNGTPLELRECCPNMKAEKESDVLSEYKSFEKIPLSSRNLLFYDVDASILKNGRNAVWFYNPSEEICQVTWCELDIKA